MPNPYFRFKQFTVYHDRCAMKVTTDACLFGAWCARGLENEEGRMEHALDIGTGTGLLSLMIAQKINVLIDAIEVDERASEQAKENVLSSSFREKIKIIHANALSFAFDKKYDVIICNPPFYEDDLASPSLRKNTAHHSSSLKLNQVLQKIAALLKDDGTFYLLLPFKRKEEIERLLIQHSLFVHMQLSVRQTEDHSPFRLIVKGMKSPSNKIEEEIDIKENSRYGAAFVQLMKDYYLYL
jgi:tRNA1Val (adenine37-N6)-methyltransferase